MIRHIVMWKVAGDNNAKRLGACRLIKEQFESLAGKIPGLLHIEVGIDESRIDYASDVVLLSHFESPEALQAYAEHPAHAAVQKVLLGLRIARQQVDYLVPERK